MQSLHQERLVGSHVSLADTSTTFHHRLSPQNTQRERLQKAQCSVVLNRIEITFVGNVPQEYTSIDRLNSWWWWRKPS